MFIYLHLRLGPLVFFLRCVQLFLVRRINGRCFQESSLVYGCMQVIFICLKKCACICTVMLALITGEFSMVTRWSYHRLIRRAFPCLHIHGLQLLLQPLVLFFCNMEQCLQSNIIFLKHLVELLKLIEPQLLWRSCHSQLQHLQSVSSPL